MSMGVFCWMLRNESEEKFSVTFESIAACMGLVLDSSTPIEGLLILKPPVGALPVLVRKTSKLEYPVMTLWEPSGKVKVTFGFVWPS